MIVPTEVGKVLHDVERHHEVSVSQKVKDLDQASFRVQAGVPTIEVPHGNKFQDVHEQASSVLQAVSHAHLYTQAKAQVEQATGRGEVDEKAQARVAMYEAPRNTREKSDEWAKAELAASYATMNRTTAIPATYVPAESAANPAIAEKWAQQLETQGGMAEVSRDITSVELPTSRIAPRPTARCARNAPSSATSSASRRRRRRTGTSRFSPAATPASRRRRPVRPRLPRSRLRPRSAIRGSRPTRGRLPDPVLTGRRIEGPRRREASGPFLFFVSAGCSGSLVRLGAVRRALYPKRVSSFLMGGRLMNSLPVAGRQSLYLQMMGENLATISRALIPRTSLFLPSGCCPASCRSLPMCRLAARRFHRQCLQRNPVSRFARAAILPWRRRRPARRLSCRLRLLPSAVVPEGPTVSPPVAFRRARARRKRPFPGCSHVVPGVFSPP